MSLVLDDKRILVIGGRRTGVAAARFAAARGAAVRMTDRAATGFEHEQRALADLPIEWRLGEEGSSLLDEVDLVIPSPGVPRSSTLLATARVRGIPVLAEVEIAFRCLSVPLYAVTGTNGKSTTTELLGEMLRRAGLRVFVGGNLGTPLVEAVDQPLDAVVAEISSFQLEWTEELRPTVGAFLNLTDDHLDRYDSLNDYGEVKARLFARQTEAGWSVLSRDDPWVWRLRRSLRSRVISFGTEPVECGAFVREGAVVVRLPESAATPLREITFPMARSRLRGLHNLENVMAAGTMALIAGAPAIAVQSAIDAFSGLPHRLEMVRQKDGVAYVDDSKGTNVGAVVKSLASTPAPVILLAGGVDKGGSYEPLRSLVRERVKRLIVFGDAREKISQALGSETETLLVSDLGEAVQRAAEMARAGDTVLLSPACASFDMFRDYAERGNRFRELVEAL